MSDERDERGREQGSRRREFGAQADCCDGDNGHKAPYVEDMSAVKGAASIDVRGRAEHPCGIRSLQVTAYRIDAAGNAFPATDPVTNASVFHKFPDQSCDTRRVLLGEHAFPLAQFVAGESYKFEYLAISCCTTDNSELDFTNVVVA